MDALLQNYLKKFLQNVSPRSAAAVLELNAEGATVPFMARYRKEKTGNLDEVAIRAVIDAHETFSEITKRKAFLVKEIGEQGNLTAEIKARIEKSWDLGELEEIYRPYKKKKKTKATIARDAGLEPLAQWIWDVGHGLLADETTVEVKAKNFLNIPAGIANYDMAIKSALDIIVEKIANDIELRNFVQASYFDKAVILSKRTKNFKPHSKFEMYGDFKESVKSLMDSKANHRYLAMRRGWEEEELSVEVSVEEEPLLKKYEIFSTTRKDDAIAALLKQCAKQALSVYVVPSVVNEVHRTLKEKADLDAITVFSENVKRVLLSSPFGAKIVLGVDPGLKTGCKIALVDRSGQFITHTVMQILGDAAEEKARKLLSEALKQMPIEAIAVGNGTAGRQTEIFIRKILKEIEKEIPVVMVNESGASVYSASEAARQEFPELDITVKGAISIARRLQDPLAELVKIDPKSIGVGQYQHDVNQNQLKKSLDATVESCVNNVGVDVNTASPALLSFVSGIGPSLALNIVEARKKALFQDRGELQKVPRLTAKVYEQAAGFLRIQNGKTFLDSTGIHPERYSSVREMAREAGVNVADLVNDGAKKILGLKEKWSKLIGEYTFDDIIRELEKPGRDPRDPFKVFKFRDDIFEVKDLKEGMICPGLVTNVTNFGAFVDIGVHQDGLAHISELSHQFVNDPRKVVNPGDQVTVRVLTVDLDKKQIGLSMKLEAPPARVSEPRNTERSRPQHDRNQSNGRPTNARADQRSRPQQKNFKNDQGSSQNRGEQKPRPAAKPFNNPFAALQTVPVKKP